MEYSPMLVIVLWALTPSDCLTLAQRTNFTEEVARVKEMQGPSMTMREEVIPGYFTFNDGQPFLVEKDPLTGNLNFNIKTTPVKSSQQFFRNPEDDYEYEDDGGYDKENIDRKDGGIYGLKNYGYNDIKGSNKGQEDLHKFLNLPVHYNSHNKFPLISSSYANTKVQGHGSSSLSNHKPYSSTTGNPQSIPTSTMKPTPKQEEPTRSTWTTPQSTTTQRITTTTSRYTTPSTTTSAYDYEYVDYYDDKYDQEASEKPAANLIPFGQYPSSTYTTTTLPVTSTKKPTTIYFTSPSTATTTTATTTTTTLRPSTTTSTTTTRRPPTYYTEPTETSIRPVTTTTKEKLAIVTSLPIDPKEEELDKTPLLIKLSTTTNKIDFMSTKSNLNTDHHLNSSNPLIEDSSSNIVINVSEKPTASLGDVEFGMRLTTYGPHRDPPVNKTKIELPNMGYGVPVPGLRPPPYGYGGVPPFQPMGSVHPHPLQPKRPHINVDYKPNFEGNYVKPQHIGNAHPTMPHTYLTVGSNSPTFHQPVLNKPPFFPEDQAPASSINHHSYNNAVKHKVPESMNHGDNFNIVVGNNPKYPQQVNTSSSEGKKPGDINLEYHGKPPQPPKVNHPHYEAPIGHPNIQFGPKRPQFPESPQPPSEGFSLVPDNQFVKVPQDQVNPSYSLQTSFSIGAPQYEDEKEPSTRPMHGIGQVLFPDDEKVIEGNKRPTPWPQGQSGPPPNSPPIHHPHNPNGRPLVPPQTRPTQRFPPELHQAGENYQRPPWESHMKHPYVYNPGQKKEPMNPPPPGFHTSKRPKPPGVQRPDLPNILPQFRPNAKVGPGEYHGPPPHPNHPPFLNPSKIREPFDTLQPPPLPRPQFLRHHGGDEHLSEKKIDKKEGLPVHLPLVHKRMTGPHSGSRVTPLGFIQNLPPRNAMHRNDVKEYEKKKDEPVFVVYPSNGGNKPTGPQSEGVVVVGTRGSQRPLPPDNLGISEDLDPFPLDDNNNFPMPGRDRSDTPILKSKTTPKPQQKLDFPFTLIKPGSVEPPQKIINGGMIDLKKEYTAYSPTISASTEEMLLKEHDSEINIIPYLQDYMPFATKKPLKKPIDSWNIDDKPTMKPLSVTLNTLLGSTKKPIINHLMITEKVDSEPERQDFQAPFHASLSEPSQGWSVVTQNNLSSNKTSEDQTTLKPTDTPKFDLENFKPELLSGFKPIIPPKYDDDRPATADT